MLNSKHRPKLKNSFTIFLNYLIMIFLSINIVLLFFNLSSKQLLPISPNNSNQNNPTTHYTNPISRQYSALFNDNYTDEELEIAINELHLPTWSRSYVHCSNPKSEVTCSQVIHSYRILNGWVQRMNSTTFSQNYHMFMQHYYDGVANRMSTDAATFILALYGNRTFTIESF